MQVITREALAAWLDVLARDRTLVAPHEEAGVLLYRPVESSAEMVWEYTRPVLSVKEAFFPATEQLLAIEKTGQSIVLQDTLPEGEQVIFGVRPCDARGVRALDALFVDTAPADPYYARRRAQTTLVGLACKSMGPSCFCTSVGGAPDAADGMDVMLAEVHGPALPGGPHYGVQALTAKGRALLETLELQEAECTPYSPVRNDPVALPAAEAWRARFADAEWERLAERCLSCRVCAYVCPTCRCFAVRDERLPAGDGHERFERIRCWDSCAGENYRRIAGGHNPRALKGQRLRNRFFCKFYYYPEQYGPVACTGCGRCIDACPVDVDVTEVLAYVSAGAGTGGA